jgi:hypothetical protein
MLGQTFEIVRLFLLPSNILWMLTCSDTVHPTFRLDVQLFDSQPIAVSLKN